MRILAVSDKEDKLLASRLAHGGIDHPNVVVSCGDLNPTYLDYVATLANAPLLYVRGNHDVDARGYADMGGTPLDGQIVTVGGVRFAGLDGSFLYREGIIGRTEGEMRRQCYKLLAKSLLAGGVDVLVTHAPARGYGDLEDLPHRGFECFNWLLKVLHPTVMLHGHVHLDYGIIEREVAHPSGVRVINTCGYQVIEI